MRGEHWTEEDGEGEVVVAWRVEIMKCGTQFEVDRINPTLEFQGL